MSETLGNVKKVIHTTSDAFEKDVLASEAPVMVDFYADWCGPCRVVAPTIEQLAHEYEGKVRFVKVNVDENADVASQYGVMGIPTFVLFRGGKEVNRIVGAASKDYFRKWIGNHLVGDR